MDKPESRGERFNQKISDSHGFAGHDRLTLSLFIKTCAHGYRKYLPRFNTSILSSGYGEVHAENIPLSEEVSA